MRIEDMIIVKNSISLSEVHGSCGNIGKKLEGSKAKRQRATPIEYSGSNGEGLFIIAGSFGELIIFYLEEVLGFDLDSHMLVQTVGSWGVNVQS